MPERMIARLDALERELERLRRAIEKMDSNGWRDSRRQVQAMVNEWAAYRDSRAKDIAEEAEERGKMQTQLKITAALATLGLVAFLNYVIGLLLP